MNELEKVFAHLRQLFFLKLSGCLESELYNRFGILGVGGIGGQP